MTIVNYIKECQEVDIPENKRFTWDTVLYKKCLYCEKKVKEEDVHFACPICNRGMCHTCYEKLQGTEEQIFDIDELDDLDNEKYNKLIKSSKGATRLICYDCYNRLLPSV